MVCKWHFTTKVLVSLYFALSYGRIRCLRRDIDGKALELFGEVEKTLFSCRNAIYAHVWAENFGDHDGAVGLLKILHNCNPGATRR